MLCIKCCFDTPRHFQDIWENVKGQEMRPHRVEGSREAGGPPPTGLTLALAGGSMRPPEIFCDASRTMRRIVLKFCIAYGESFAQLLVKTFDRVMSGHGAMTSQVVHKCQTIFARNSGIWLIRRRYDTATISFNFLVQVKSKSRSRSGQ